jgi:tight adherence protein C
MITTALICGSGVGIGVAIILRYYVPTRVSLRAALDSVTEVEQLIVPTSQQTDFIDRIGRPFVPLVEVLGLPMERLRRDLTITDRSFERHLAEKAALAIFGAAVVPLTAGVLVLGGIRFPIAIPLWIALLLGVVFFFVPDLGVRAEAERRRKSFRHGLTSFLGLVVIGLAGGGGVESALENASAVGKNWAFLRIRRCLDEARFAKQTPWTALGRLGAELDINELVELAASVSLAGSEGAKIRQSLEAKAASLRNHQLSEAEMDVQSASERMAIPVGLLFGGYLLFIGYPAISAALVSL